MPFGDRRAIQCQARGFTLSVLPREFLVHFPHEYSESREIKNVQGVHGSQRGVNNKIFDLYRAWLMRRYATGGSEHEAMLKLCTSNKRAARIGAKGNFGAKFTPGTPMLRPLARSGPDRPELDKNSARESIV